MNMRPLMIDAVARAKIAHVIAHAEEHPYHPDADPVPGDQPEFVAMLGTYRCVFTITLSAGKRHRHLSISVPAKGKFPNPAAAFTIATEFGFTGWDGRTLHKLPEGWKGDVSEREHCLVLAQEAKR